MLYIRIVGEPADSICKDCPFLRKVVLQPSRVTTVMSSYFDDCQSKNNETRLKTAVIESIITIAINHFLLIVIVSFIILFFVYFYYNYITTNVNKTFLAERLIVIADLMFI